MDGIAQGKDYFYLGLGESVKGLESDVIFVIAAGASMWFPTGAGKVPFESHLLFTMSLICTSFMLASMPIIAWSSVVLKNSTIARDVKTVRDESAAARQNGLLNSAYG